MSAMKIAGGGAAGAGARRFGLLAALLVLCGAARAFAAFEDLGVGARAPGMGNAFTAIADDVYAIHYNPAGLSLLPRPELAASYHLQFVGLGDNSRLNTSFLGYAQPLKDGKWGTAAGAWKQFSLNSSLYQENTIYLSYGRLALRDLGPGDLYLGGNLKYLMRSFGSLPEASNGYRGLNRTGQADPVLSGSRRSAAPDLDLGAMYRFRRHYVLGMSLVQVAQPNVAFAAGDSDRLPLGLKLAMSYQSLLSNVAAQYETQTAPTGARDQRLAVALERWVPRLFVGDFGVRGGAAVGSRDLLELTAGLSYRTRRMGIDYGFSMPINTVASTAGSHRFSFSIRFGSMSEEEESVELILEAMRRLKGGQMPELRALAVGLSPTQKALLDEHLAAAKSLELQAKYREALDRFSQATALSPEDQGLKKGFTRLNFVAQFVKALPEYKSDPVQAALHQGILAYLAEDEAAAVEKVSRGLSLDPENKAVDGFLAQLELATGLKRLELPKAPAAGFELQQKLTQAASAIEEARYEECIALSTAVVQADKNILAAWENLGTCYFAKGEYALSLESWQTAVSLEKNPARRSVLRGYLASISNVLKRPKAPPAPAAMTRRGSPVDVQRLYGEGIDQYSAGNLDKAKRLFERVLELEPDHTKAAKALKRIKEEMAPK